ncbi:MAG TPA: carboxypeptidase regulatory-like domain-containing protein [Casimicrobiaceae bacterium]|nr:carboxypeptidase regulatory-like domain-containing protein [Casimicrobiaceae bacterium]
MKGMRVAPGMSVLLAALLLAPGVALCGSIKGKVVLAGAVPAPKKVDVTIDQYVCGTAKDPDDLLLSPQKELKNAVVWIDNPPVGKAPALPDKVEMDQSKCEFVPHIVIVPAGGTVDFLNSDRLLHNIHTTPKINPPVNRTQPKSRTIPITFEKPEIVRINCDLHAWMQAWVVVAAHSFYAVTGADGQFSFDNLPPGTYKLSVWHERLGTVQASATVTGQQEAKLTVEMKSAP